MKDIFKIFLKIVMAFAFAYFSLIYFGQNTILNMEGYKFISFLLFFLVLAFFLVLRLINYIKQEKKLSLIDINSKQNSLGEKLLLLVSFSKMECISFLRDYFEIHSPKASLNDESILKTLKDFFIESNARPIKNRRLKLFEKVKIFFSYGRMKDYKTCLYSIQKEYLLFYHYRNILGREAIDNLANKFDSYKNGLGKAYIKFMTDRANYNIWVCSYLLSKQKTLQFIVAFFIVITFSFKVLFLQNEVLHIIINFNFFKVVYNEIFQLLYKKFLILLFLKIFFNVLLV